MRKITKRQFKEFRLCFEDFLSEHAWERIICKNANEKEFDEQYIVTEKVEAQLKDYLIRHIL